MLPVLPWIQVNFYKKHLPLLSLKTIAAVVRTQYLIWLGLTVLEVKLLLRICGCQPFVWSGLLRGMVRRKGSVLTCTSRKNLKYGPMMAHDMRKWMTSSLIYLTDIWFSGKSFPSYHLTFMTLSINFNRQEVSSLQVSIS